MTAAGGGACPAYAPGNGCSAAPSAAALGAARRPGGGARPEGRLEACPRCSGLAVLLLQLLLLLLTLLLFLATTCTAWALEDASSATIRSPEPFCNTQWAWGLEPQNRSER